MSSAQNFPTITFTKKTDKPKGTLVFLVAEGGKLPVSAVPYNKDGRLDDAIKIANFKGAHGAMVSVLAPAKAIDRALIIGLGKQKSDKAKKLDEDAWMKIGGKLYHASGKSAAIHVFCDLAVKKKTDEIGPEEAALIAAGATLRSYKFDRYKTKKGDGKKEDKKAKQAKPSKISFIHSKHDKAKSVWKIRDAIASGVVFARDLVNEPANILSPVEFAKRAGSLKKLGCKVKILDETKMAALGMHALLGVAQGSVRPPRVAIIEWKGGKAKDKPLAFIGKGVVFDTGGISIKPAGGMEDMKGDMGGAAAVCGLMHALAARKAKTNAVGVIGLVENMPDGNAQRPGDIVTSMSGQTIEVLNTDAEGRLVLADLLWLTEKDYKPQFMINLATLTGAILVALGKQYAGLFCNDDKLAKRLIKAGEDTKELVWRMPLSPEFDKMIDSKNADMKNIGGRFGGSITAAQFLQRFVRDVPWAHLDIAGTAMGSPANEYSQSWASGYGVRLLNRLVAESYED